MNRNPDSDKFQRLFRGRMAVKQTMQLVEPRGDTAPILCGKARAGQRNSHRILLAAVAQVEAAIDPGLRAARCALACERSQSVVHQRAQG